MKPPIFVYLDGTLDVFSTKEKAEAYNEAQTIAEYKAVAYDSEGLILEVSIAHDSFVTINPVIPPVKKPEELRELIQSSLKLWKRNRPSDEWIKQAPLHELVAKTLEFKTQ